MIIIASKPGQLGNSLFLYSHFIAFSKEHEILIVNPSFNDYSKYFEATHKSTVCRFPEKKTAAFRFFKTGKIIYSIANYFGRLLYKLKVRNSAVQCIYIDWNETFFLDDPASSAIPSKSRITFVQGWKFRCPQYVKKHYAEIKKMFSPLPFHQENIERLMYYAKNNCDILVGMHIRHGDYKKFEGGKFYFGIDVYKKIMQRVLELFPNKKVRFLVCTNSNENLASLKPIDFISGNNHELEDLYSFSQCDYLIGPPSTYTMWASFYGKVPLCQLQNEDCNFTLNDFKISVHE